MNSQKIGFTRWVVLTLILTSLSALAVSVHADSRRGVKNRAQSPVVRHRDADRRQTFYKNRYYPIGHRVRSLPRGYFSFSIGSGRYYYQSGVYYRHRGSNYVVVQAPLGAFINVLPYGYRTFYLGGIPYFYASGVFYNWNDRYRAYEVVRRPDSIADLQEDQVAEVKDVFVYPRHGQSPEQTSKDRYECYLWAKDQTGFDPSSGEAGDTNAYRRALGACLEGRGYTVK